MRSIAGVGIATDFCWNKKKKSVESECLLDLMQFVKTLHTQSKIDHLREKKTDFNRFSTN